MEVVKGRWKRRIGRRIEFAAMISYSVGIDFLSTP